MKAVIKITIATILLASLITFFSLENNWIDVTNYHYESSKVSSQLDGFKICQISDLHSKQFGNNNSRLIKKVKNGKPDIIVLTGDMISNAKDNYSISLDLMKELVKISPTYYVSGNHEKRMKKADYDDYINKVRETGVKVLMDEKLDFVDYTLIGVENKKTSDSLNKVLDNLNIDQTRLNILLSHQPELFKSYSGIDITFSGHVHGGQIRLFGQGLFAPGQGFFPKYTSGIYNKDKDIMVVSRGLGSSSFPFRIFNRPHLVFLTLNEKK